MKTLTTTWTGIRPLVLHNGLLADPVNPVVIAIKKICAKKNKKTDSDNMEIGRLEWLGGLYLAADGKTIVLPSDNIERCVQEGARKSRLGKDAQAACFCTDAEVVIDHPDIKGRSPETLFNEKGGRFILRKGVKVTTNRVIRVRPMIPTGWSITFTMEFDETIINVRDLIKAMVDAGSVVGLGDWRPKFGRFTVEVAE